MASGTQMISGLSSGIDWRTMVDQIIAIDSRQINSIQTQQKAFDTRRNAWQDINSKLSALKAAVEALRKPETFNKFSSVISANSSTKGSDLLSVTLNANASQGSFDVQILQRASSEKLSSNAYASRTEALGLSGQFLLGGRVVTLSATDTLTNLRDKINATNSGSNPSGVTASLLTSGTDSFRLVLTASESGSAGIAMLDASSSNVLQSLGLVDGGTQIRHATSSGAKSDGFASADSAVASMRNLAASPSGTVSIGAYAGISIDLSQSLSEIKDSINLQAGTNIADIVSETDSRGATIYRLQLTGTTFSDDNNVLQVLGVLQGTHGAVAEIHQSAAMTRTTAAGGGAIGEATTFAQINTGAGLSNVVNGDTIQISGRDRAGNAVSGTFTISDVNTTNIGDLLARIEEVYGAQGNTVTASVDGSGRITITDDQSGDSLLSVKLVANNQGGGSLDFGAVSVTTEGRQMQIQAGQNARFIVDGVQLERASNTISDVVAGVSFDLLKAEAGTTISVAVNRDKAAINNVLNDFVGKYNSVVSWISSQMSYDQEKKETGGPLFGDSTLGGLSNRLLNTVISRVTGTSTELSTLALLGIKLQDNGNLSLDQSTFSGLLDSDFQNIVDFFSVKGSTSSSALEYVNYARQTQQGTYDVVITQAAAQAKVTGATNLSGGLAGNETLTVTDKASGQVAIVSLTAGMSLEDIVAAVNSEMARSYTQTLTSSQAMSLTSAAGGGVMTMSSTFAQLNTGGDASDVEDGDIINFNLTLNGGRSVAGAYKVTDAGTNSVGDLLNAIRVASGDTVTARVDSNGRIVVTDNRTGSSALSLNLTYSGEGSLDFGTMDTTVTGRYAMNITAADNGSGSLSLTHRDYGSHQGFSLAQSSGLLGFDDGETAGLDVQGTINGEAASGRGQVLTGDSGANNVDGLVIRYTGLATGSIGTVSFNLGFGESMERLLYNYTDPYTGFIEAKRKGLKQSSDSMTNQIERLNVRLDMKRESLINQFIAMEKTISALQGQSSWLGAQIGKL